jgi:hypothetical protein
MPKICLSCRRSESAAITGRILDRLVAHYGKDSVFLDIDSIPYGIDFRQHVQEVLRQVDVLVAVVGPKWPGSRDGGAARIHDDNDPIRIEIHTDRAQSTRADRSGAGGRRQHAQGHPIDDGKQPEMSRRHSQKRRPWKVKHFSPLAAGPVATGLRAGGGSEPLSFDNGSQR